MGQKVNPISLRLGLNRKHDSQWFSLSGYSQCVAQSLKLRKHFQTIFEQARLAPSRIRLSRTGNAWTVLPILHSPKTSPQTRISPETQKDSPLQYIQSHPLNEVMLNSQKSKLATALRYALGGLLANKTTPQEIYQLTQLGLRETQQSRESNIFQSTIDAWQDSQTGGLKIRPLVVSRRWESAEFVAFHIAACLERRMPLRRVFSQLIQEAVRTKGIVGIRMTVSGRLNGAAIARSSSKQWGRVPLHGLSESIDYAFQSVYTSYGLLGVKVWMCYDKS